MTNPSDRVRVKHIGKHARRADTMSGEGTVWNGEGDIQTVSRRAWENHLKKHPDLWELAEDDEQGKQAPASTAEVDAQRAENERVAAELAEQRRKLEEQAEAQRLQQEALDKRQRELQEQGSPTSGASASAGLDSVGSGSTTDYEAQDRNALAKLCTERKIEVDGRSSKAVLIEALKAADLAKSQA